MTALTQDNVRRLDALNLIEAIAADDRDKAVSIMALYREMDQAENPDHVEPCASHALAWTLAFCAARFLHGYRSIGGDLDLDKLRASMLSDEAQP
jgi:hypothetical protein